MKFFTCAYTLPAGFISTSEISEKFNMHQAMFTVLIKKYGLEEDVDFKRVESIAKGKGLKMTLFVNKNSMKWPSKFRAKLQQIDTDYSNVVDLNKFANEFAVELEKGDLPIVEEYFCAEPLVVGKKCFSRLNNKGKDVFKTKTIYVLDKKDFIECTEQNLLTGHIELTNGKYFVWYDM